MPIYEYECSACGKKSEVLQAMSAAAPDKCSVCGQGPVKRLISVSGFVLKGGGFYSNEYPSASRKAGMAESKPAAVKSAATESNKTSAPESKAEPVKSVASGSNQSAKSEPKSDTVKSSSTESKV